MKTVTDNKKEIIIKNSKFISLTFYIDDIKDVNNKLKEIKKQYRNATHYCFAYIVNNKEKAEDDGEPTGTAGIPILNVLKKEKLNNTLCIIVRYFGGIKLGSGGLIRAYSKACKDCLSLIDLQKGYLLQITTTYENIKYIEYLLDNNIITNKKFAIDITFNVTISIEVYDNLINKLKEKSIVKIVKEIYF